MKKNLTPIIIIAIIAFGCRHGKMPGNQGSYAIIPAPVMLSEKPGKFEFTEKCKVIISGLNEETRIPADLLVSLLKNPTGWKIEIGEGAKAQSGSVFMSLDTAVKNPEGYKLSVRENIIVIKAGTAAGLFYAVQTLRQLMPPMVEKDSIVVNPAVEVPCCEISDEPRFSYRGMHLDVGRHFFPVSTIKRYIDLLASQKMNTFHWHLTDDQGWRIEIKKYPGLTGVGAFRKETVVGHAHSKPELYDGKPYGGFYTQDEIKDVVAYARSKFITIIPEIEMPGHAMAALAAYPGLSCTGGPFEVAKTWGVFDNVFCAGKEETYKFLEDVISEVADLFPSKYIHVGGDECPKTKWAKCRLCQKRMKDEGLKDEKELQSYFIKRMEKFITSKGKKLIGWDEILEGGIAPEATVMSWRGVEGGIEAAKQNHDVIMTPSTYVYLDYYQSDPKDQPLAIGGHLTLEKVYSFDPRFDQLTAEQNAHILGLQGNVWTEYISTPSYLEYMLCPRMMAISETGWTPSSKKDFEDFLARFNVLKKHLDMMGVNYFKGEYRD
ncbi:MAG TPA: beta-N-acetylhexosaminidase [Bacteroidales bacterium]|nr:beta-N-acetylhexosaminidase [Bacteroidales bacterium]